MKTTLQDNGIGVKPIFSNRLLVPLPTINPSKINFSRKPENDGVIKRV